MSPLPIRHSTSHRREHHTARNGRNEERTAKLCVPAETAQPEGEDGGETGRLEAEDEGKHDDGGGASGGHGGYDEDEAEAKIDGQDVAGLDGGDRHEAAGDEAV